MTSEGFKEHVENERISNIESELREFFKTAFQEYADVLSEYQRSNIEGMLSEKFTETLGILLSLKVFCRDQINSGHATEEEVAAMKDYVNKCLDECTEKLPHINTGIRAQMFEHL